MFKGFIYEIERSWDINDAALEDNNYDNDSDFEFSSNDSDTEIPPYVLY